MNVPEVVAELCIIAKKRAQNVIIVVIPTMIMNNIQLVILNELD
tara:strand:- start:373 stop:504 length:132 start_codon:yes stop_codon:yes gene_type:complete